MVAWQPLSLERSKWDEPSHTGCHGSYLGFQSHSSAPYPATYYLLLITKKATIGETVLDLQMAMINQTLVTQDN